MNHAAQWRSLATQLVVMPVLGGFTTASHAIADCPPHSNNATTATDTGAAVGGQMLGGGFHCQLGGAISGLLGGFGSKLPSAMAG